MVAHHHVLERMQVQLSMQAVQHFMEVHALCICDIGCMHIMCSAQRNGTPSSTRCRDADQNAYRSGRRAKQPPAQKLAGSLKHDVNLNIRLLPRAVSTQVCYAGLADSLAEAALACLLFPAAVDVIRGTKHAAT